MADKVLMATPNAVGSVEFYKQYGSQLRDLVGATDNLSQSGVDQSRKFSAVLLQDVAEGEYGLVFPLYRSTHVNNFRLDMLSVMVEQQNNLEHGIPFKFVVNQFQRDTRTMAILPGATTIVDCEVPDAIRCSPLDLAKAIVQGSGGRVSISDLLVQIGFSYIDQSLVINTNAYETYFTKGLAFQGQGNFANKLNKDTIFSFPGTMYVTFGGKWNNVELMATSYSTTGTSDQRIEDQGIIVTNTTPFIPGGYPVAASDCYTLPFTCPLKGGSVVVCEYLENGIGLAITGAQPRHFSINFAGF